MGYSAIRTGQVQLDRNLDSLSNALRSTPIQWTYVGFNNGPAFQNGWVNADPNFSPEGTNGRNTKFGIDSAGFVVIVGVIKSGTIGSTVFTLPAGFRPERNFNFAVVSNAAFGACAVNTDGTVVPATGSNVQFRLDGVRFQQTQ